MTQQAFRQHDDDERSAPKQREFSPDGKTRSEPSRRSIEGALHARLLP